MEQIHAFIKGISADIDPSKRDSLSWDFPTEGIRILNHEGQGMMIVPLPGNSNAPGDTTATIPLTAGYTAIGACTFAGIIYLALYNEKTYYTELGSFPSINPYTKVIQQSYSPFYNLLAGSTELAANGTGARLPFVTMELGYTVGSQLEMFAAPSYDESVNLYICDYENPNLCINSGFNLAGYNRQTYNDLSFPYGVQHIKFSSKFPKATLNPLTSDGVLLPGNYFLFFRYVTASFDRTAFLSELGPVSVFNGELVRAIEGVVDEGGAPSNKAINITLSNLDRDYSYLEVGIMRYHGPSISASIREMYLAHQYYEINGESIDISITGMEEQEVITIADILNYNNVPLICKSHTTAANRYIGTNWKDIAYDSAALIAFASKVYPDIVYKEIEDLSIGDYESNGSIIPQFKSTSNILDSRSHIRGEIYPYGISFIFVNGKRSEAYPIMSCRYTYNTYTEVETAVPVNDGNGLIEIPDFVQDNAYVELRKRNDLSQAIGLSFVMTDANAYFELNKAKFPNVLGFVIVGGQRKPNMLYQGVSVQCFNKIRSGTIVAEYFGENNATAMSGLVTESESLYLPLPKRLAAADWYRLPSTTDSTVTGSGKHYSVGGSSPRFALYAPDYIFGNTKKANEAVKCHIKYLADLGFNNTFFKEDRGVRYLFEITKSNKATINYAPAYGGTCSIKYTTGDNYNEGDQWSSRFNDYRENQSEFGIIISGGNNRTISSQRYIGLKPDVNLVSYDHAFLVLNKYASQELYWAGIQAAFSLKDEKYTAITNVFPMSQSLTIADVYKGDCFLNRNIFRTHHWHSIPTESLEDSWYTHGYAMSFVSENTVNNQLRSELILPDLTYTFFPRSLTHSSFSTFLKWAVTEKSDDTKVESCYVNAGYNRLYGENVILGYNKYMPYVRTKYPNRIWLSSVQSPGSFVNNFRQFGILAYKDFPWEDGPINSIKELFGKLISICDRAINEHFYNESQYRVPTNQGELLLGATEVLADQCRKIASYGSKHTHGIGVVESAIVGVDTDKDIIWRVLPGEGGLKAENMSQSYQIQSWCREKFAELKAINPILDTPSWGNGVAIGYDPYFKEIHFSFLTSTIVSENIIDPRIVFKYGSYFNGFATSDVRNIASAGWRVPAIADHNILIANIGGNLTAGDKLKEAGTIYWSTGLSGTTNSRKFNGRGAGYRNVSGAYDGFRFSLMLQTLEANGGISLISNSHASGTWSTTGIVNPKRMGLPVRLIKDGTLLMDGQEGVYVGNDLKVYRTICIGTQEWLADNLAETQYRTGAFIPVVSDNIAWSLLTTGARCSPDGDDNNIIGTNIINVVLSREIHGKTISFSEEINAFLGTAPFAAARYYTNGKDFFSSLQPSEANSNGLYQHNNKATSMVFYGAQKDMLVTVVVNGLSEEGNTSQLRKIFKAGSVVSGPNAFHSLEINTLHQHGALSPFLNTVQFWKSAEYMNHIWEYPLPLQDNIDTDQFQIETDMRGLWAKITLTYRNIETTFIHSIRTLFNVTSI